MTKTHSGWVTFAGVMLFIVGVLNVIYGIAAIGDSSFFAHDQKYILSNLNTWGWVTIGLAGLEALTGALIWFGSGFGRWLGITLASLALILAMMSIPAYPLWSLAVFAIDIIIIHQVAKYGEGGAGAEAPDPEKLMAARQDVARTPY
jgi:hypothetical protein